MVLKMMLGKLCTGPPAFLSAPSYSCPKSMKAVIGSSCLRDTHTGRAPHPRPTSEDITQSLPYKGTCCGSLTKSTCTPMKKWQLGKQCSCHRILPQFNMISWYGWGGLGWRARTDSKGTWGAWLGDGNSTYLDCGGSYITVYIWQNS